MQRGDQRDHVGHCLVKATVLRTQALGRRFVHDAVQEQMSHFVREHVEVEAERLQLTAKVDVVAGLDEAVSGLPHCSSRPS